MSRILGIDFGRKRVGLALGDLQSGVVTPFKVVQNDRQLLAHLKNLCEEYRVTQIVLGLPVSKKYHEAETAVRAFSEHLSKKTGYAIVFQDERESTVYATTLLKTKGWNEKQIREKVDMFAAMKILEDYLKKAEK